MEIGTAMEMEMEMEMDFDAMAAAINAIAESQVEYETTHRDAGDSYAYMVAESWSDYDTTRLIDYMKDHGIDYDGVDVDDIVSEILECFRMEPGYIYGAGNGTFLLTSFAVGEVEMEIECDTIGRAWTRELCETLSRKSNVFLRYYSESMALGYIATDSVWNAEVSAERIKLVVGMLKTKLPE